MSGEAVDTGERQIVESILSDAEIEARRHREDAERAAQAELDGARRKADTVRQEILKAAEQTAAKAYAREVATAKAEARRILLAGREEFVGRALVQIGEGLAALRNDAQRYRESLGNLAREAALAVDEPEVVLKVGKRDEAIADAGFLEELSRSIGLATGRAPKLTLEVASGDLGGGCVAVSGNGRVVFDNTFRRRMERGMREIRGAIVKETVQDDG
jgi:vacuolar-type H+-ATPase subunit E/Vma4